MIKTRKILAFLLSLLVFLTFVPSLVAVDVSLYFNPAVASYNVGQSFSVSVFVSSSDQAMNAVSANIFFPKDKLEVTSLSKGGSIISLWVQEPSFSNSTGSISCEGIVLNPGFKGTAGRVITINFKVKSAGEAILSFSSGSVLANDGSGTSILSALGSAKYILIVPTTGPTAPQATTPTEVTGVPEAPQITSNTHPDSTKWYADNDPVFEWAMPLGITGVSLYINDRPSSNPGSVSDGLFTSYSTEDIDNGSWYFHLRLRNQFGWGTISHFRFQVDTVKPSFLEIEEIKREDLIEPRVEFKLTADDATSGIDHYEIKIDDSETQIWQDDGNHIYQTEAIDPGDHTLVVKVLDKAGNFLVDSAEFIVEPLEAPVFIEYPKQLGSGEALIIRGQTYSDIQVNVWLQKDQDEAELQTVRSNNLGEFTFVANKKLTGGIYQIWAQAIDERGAKSNFSDKITIAVAKPKLLGFMSNAVIWLSVLVPLTALIILLFFIFWYSKNRFVMYKKKLNKEVREAEEATKFAFDFLKKDLQASIKLLENAKSSRRLTKEEEMVFKKLKDDLAYAEKHVKKEIKDIKHVG
ncbi:hypothetical protein KKF32_02585 [Patescibacteria group bacterium]|nr:hypothetical protein [Patescibacteria group bacterium]